MKSQGGSRGVAVLFFNFGARWRVVVNATPLLLYLQERDLIDTHCTEGWVGPGPVGVGVENLFTRM
jgi:hypothetical protein